MPADRVVRRSPASDHEGRSVDGLTPGGLELGILAGGVGHEGGRIENAAVANIPDLEAAVGHVDCPSGQRRGHACAKQPQVFAVMEQVERQVGACSLDLHRPYGKEGEARRMGEQPLPQVEEVNGAAHVGVRPRHHTVERQQNAARRSATLPEPPDLVYLALRPDGPWPPWRQRDDRRVELRPRLPVTIERHEQRIRTLDLRMFTAGDCLRSDAERIEIDRGQLQRLIVSIRLRPALEEKPLPEEGYQWNTQCFWRAAVNHEEPSSVNARIDVESTLAEGR